MLSVVEVTAVAGAVVALSVGLGMKAGGRKCWLSGGGFILAETCRGAFLCGNRLACVPGLD